jgi:predicted MFS family arabinose efflux permease
MSIAIRTYFQKIADPADVAPSMAVGFTINHIAAVVIPPLGGLIWTFDYRLTFYLGMLLAFCSLLLGQAIRVPEEDRAELPAEARA